MALDGIRTVSGQYPDGIWMISGYGIWMVSGRLWTVGLSGWLWTVSGRYPDSIRTVSGQYPDGISGWYPDGIWTAPDGQSDAQDGHDSWSNYNIEY